MDLLKLWSILSQNSFPRQDLEGKKKRHYLMYRRLAMDKKWVCRDRETACNFTVCARTQEEILQKAGEHVQAVHGMKGFSKDFYQKTLRVIEEGRCSPPEEDLCEACFGT
jgi:predicted small metal-binding protein